MKRCYLLLVIFVASLAGSLVVGGVVACEPDDDSVTTSVDESAECPDIYEDRCVAESECDCADCDDEDGAYWYDAQTGEYHDLAFSEDSAFEQMVLEETAASTDTVMADNELTAAEPSIMAEDAATEQGHSQRTMDECVCDGYNDCWYEYGYREPLTVAESSDTPEGYAAGELGSDEELEMWMDAEIDRMIADSEPRDEEVVGRKAILSLARTLDQMSATLQAISQHLTEMATPEVAESQVWIDEPVLR